MRLQSRLLKLFLLSLLAFLPARADSNISYVGTVVPFAGTNQVPVHPAQFAGAGQVFIFPVPSNATLTVSFNQTVASSGDSFTVSVFQTGNPIIPNYSNNTSFWTSVGIAPSSGGTLSSATTLATQTVTSTGTAQTFSFQSQTLNGSQVAIQLASGSGTVSAFVAQAVLTLTGSFAYSTVQGVLPPTTTAIATINPVWASVMTDGANHMAWPYANPTGDGAIGMKILTTRVSSGSYGSASQGAGLDTSDPLFVSVLPVNTQYKHISAVATVQQVCPGPCVVYGVIINTGVAGGTVTVTQGGSSCPGTNTVAVIAAADTTHPMSWLPSNVGMGTGSSQVFCLTPSSTTLDITAIWTQ